MTTETLIHNLLTVHSGDLKKALGDVRTEEFVFDFMMINPMPDIFKSLTKESLFFFAFAGHLKDLKLGNKKLEQLLEPISDVINIHKLESLLSEHSKVLKLRYDSNGDLRHPATYTGLPLKVQDYIDSGKVAYECLIKYGAITDLGWKKLNWSCTSSPEAFELDGNQIYFESFKSVPVKAIDMWIEKHGLTASFKSLDDEQELWSVKEYRSGTATGFRYFDSKDLAGLIADFQRLGKIDHQESKKSA